MNKFQKSDLFLFCIKKKYIHWPNLKIWWNMLSALYNNFYKFPERFWSLGMILWCKKSSKTVFLSFLGLYFHNFAWKIFSSIASLNWYLKNGKYFWLTNGIWMRSILISMISFCCFSHANHRSHRLVAPVVLWRCLCLLHDFTPLKLRVQCFYV